MPWNTLFLSVVLYIVVPVIVAQLWRRSLLSAGGMTTLGRTLRALAPLSLSALLLTLVLLFGLQGAQIVHQPLVIGCSRCRFSFRCISMLAWLIG